MNNISVNLENLTDKERDTLLSLIKKANKEVNIAKERWKPEEGELYYHLDDKGSILKWGWSNCLEDFIRYNMGNVFKTREEAEFALEKQKVLVELERYAEEYNDSTKEPTWELMFDRYCKKIFGIDSMDVFVSNIRFTSGDLAEKAIKIIGEDRIKKYYFGVK